jgi:hypothetical protein
VPARWWQVRSLKKTPSVFMKFESVAVV